MNKFFTPSANNNLIIWAISLLCFPFSKLLATVKISPNFITILSFILMIMSCFFLVESNLLLFSLSFIFSIFLDFCDGQVARISKKSNNTKFRFDHLSDVVKISIIYLTFGMLFNDLSSWIFFFISHLLFFLNTYLHSSTVNAENLQSKLNEKKKKKFYFFQIF